MPKRAKGSKVRVPKVKNLYVVRLDDDVLKLTKFRRENPEHSPPKPCLYVGATSCSPAVRFKQHKDGYKSASIVRRFGRYLMRKKFEHLNPVAAGEAADRERALAAELRSKGYGVWQR